MNKIERNLLLRVARRMEERAQADYLAELGTTEDPRLVTAVAQRDAKTKRDRDLGDARDLKDYVRLQDAGAAETKRITDQVGAFVMLPELATSAMLEAGAAVVKSFTDLVDGNDAQLPRKLVDEVYAAIKKGAITLP